MVTVYCSWVVDMVLNLTYLYYSSIFDTLFCKSCLFRNFIKNKSNLHYARVTSGQLGAWTAQLRKNVAAVGAVGDTDPVHMSNSCGLVIITFLNCDIQNLIVM